MRGKFNNATIESVKTTYSKPQAIQDSASARSTWRKKCGDDMNDPLLMDGDEGEPEGEEKEEDLETPLKRDAQIAHP